MFWKVEIQGFPTVLSRDPAISGPYQSNIVDSPTSKHIKDFKKGIEFNNVYFQYEDNEKFLYLLNIPWWLHCAKEFNWIDYFNIPDEVIQKCKLGESKFMSNNQDCPATALKAINGAVATMTDVNPFDAAKLSVRLSNSNTNDEDVGFVNLSTSGSNVIVKFCHTKPCSENYNRRSDTIEIK